MMTWLHRLRALIEEVVRVMVEADLQLVASSMAFATMLSLVPLLAVSLSVFTAFGGLEPMLGKLEQFLLQNFVEASGAELSRAIHRAVDRAQSGAIGAGGIVGLLIASTKLFHDMEKAVQRIWSVRKGRSLFPRVLVYWAVMFLGPLILAGFLGLMGSKNLGLRGLIPNRTFIFVLAFLSFVSIYKWVPATVVHWRSALLSAAAAAAGISIAKEFYSNLMTHVLGYSALYGSLASVPIFLIWLLVLWWISLAGVALCAALERRHYGA